MNSYRTRRGFLRDALMGTLAAGLLPGASAQSTLSRRVEWTTFKKSRDYASFMDAIKKMRANTNPLDKRSWQYWSEVHVNFCPHNTPYFLAWHRGYLRLFEKQLREVSGNPGLTLPYWNYYADPNIPREFLEAASWNPLYVERVNSSVSQALTLAPFGSNLNHFQREPNDSLSNAVAFEPSLENQPHNPVHDLIGGIMTTMQSPLDPIFWLHHANIDRLMSAWVAAGDGRSLPPAGDDYWSGNFQYATRLTMPVAYTIDTRSNLLYFYDNELMPSSMPPAALTAPQGLAVQPSSAMAATATQGGGVPAAPPSGRFAATRMRVTGARRLALAGAANISLGDSSVSAPLALDRAGVQVLQAFLDSYRQSPFGLPAAPGKQYSSVKVVAARVKMNKKGAVGGYFYRMYLNLPEVPGSGEAEENYLFGNLGPFRVAARQHHGHTDMEVDIEFDVTGLILKNRGRDLSRHSFSLVRVNGDNAPEGEVISIGELRLEMA